ncbi:Short-chain dehydrogenase/reductase SDR [Penicillium expansum]|nr:Short-chain dehydrogenase/reductase SDR [Penicillium expansum]
MASVTGGVFAITGGASGIGAAVCRLLAQRGAATIWVGDISNNRFEELKQFIHQENTATQLHCQTLNITSSAEVENWMREIIATCGDLHGAANVAGIAQGAGLRQVPTILEETDAEWRNIMSVNLDGIFYCTRAEGACHERPSQTRSQYCQRGQHCGFCAHPDVYAYGTSKSAAAYFTACVAPDAISIGIRVNTVSPGITNTPLLPQFEPSAKGLDEIRQLYEKQGLPLIEPEDVARTIVWLLTEDSRPVYGANINVGAPI